MNGNHWLVGRILRGKRGRFRIVGEAFDRLWGRAVDEHGREMGGDLLYELRPAEWEQLERLIKRGPPIDG